VSEIVRFYYISSTAFAQALFSQKLGGFLEDIVGEVVLEEERRICVLPYLPDGFDKNDAWILARLVANPLAKRYALNVWRGLAAQSAQINRGQRMFLGAGPSIGFPFEGTTRLTAYGRYLTTTAGTTHFVVAWLKSCTHSMYYDGIHIENLESFDPSAETVNQEQLDGTTDGAQIINRYQKQDKTESELREDINAPRRTKGLIFNNPDQRFLDLKGKSITTGLPNSPAKRLAAAKLTTPENRDFSTSTEGNGEATRARFTTELSEDTAKSPEDYVDTTFARLNEIMRALTTQTPGFTCDWMKINQPDATLNTSNFFPGKQLGLGRRWLRIEDRHRQAAIVEITGHPKGTYYLFDIERSHEEYFALIMGFSENGSRLSETILKTALRQCASQSGVWPYAGDVTGLITVRFSHTFKTTTEFAMEIRAAMNNPNIRKHTMMRPKRKKRKMPESEHAVPAFSNVQSQERGES
jgi:hypothetical protein